MCSLRTGRTIFSELPPDLHRIKGRFFRTDKALQAFSGPPGTWQPIKLPGHQHPQSIKLILGAATDLVTRQNLRHKLSVIGVQDGHLVIKTAKQAGLKLSLDPSRGRLVLEHMPNPNPERAKGFQFAHAPQGVDYSLQFVQWRDGSRAYLDSRGLLHLRSSDDQIPEMTLVLNDANVAGWCDWNQVWGDPAFTSGSLPKISPERVFQDWLIPFCRRLV